MRNAIPKPLLWSFTFKLPLAFALVALADFFFWGGGSGSVIGAFGLVWVGASLAAHRSALQNSLALIGFGAAAIMAGVLAYEPSLIGWILFWSALSMAVLLQRSAQIGDVWQWVRRLLLHGFTSLFGPAMDIIKWSRVRRRTGAGSMLTLLPSLALPAIGGVIFLLLFAIANPIISDALTSVDPGGFSLEEIVRSIFWALMFVMVWSTLRPRRLRFQLKPLADSEPTAIAGVSVASVTMSLILFNAMFAVQNSLDIAFLWSGARLPEAFTLAEYAHRGAYPLIATALLAGLFVLITTHPKSAMAGNRLIRLLIMVWIAQNIFLVASSVERTLLYVESFSLTRLRIAALIWMGLVALGLVLILWRMLNRKSFAWLVNSNAAAMLGVLALCSICDLGSISARYNVNHNRLFEGEPVWPDLDYLAELGSSALVPLAELEQRSGLPTSYRCHVRRVRQNIQFDTELQQQNWQRWTWRDARRLKALPVDMTSKAPTRDDACSGQMEDQVEGPAPSVPYTAHANPPANSDTPLTDGETR